MGRESRARNQQRQKFNNAHQEERDGAVRHKLDSAEKIMEQAAKYVLARQVPHVVDTITAEELDEKLLDWRHLARTAAMGAFCTLGELNRLPTLERSWVEQAWERAALAAMLSDGVAGYLHTFLGERVDFLEDPHVEEGEHFGRVLACWKYRPSNGTEGSDFTAKWCDRCEKGPDYEEFTDCSIIAASEVYDIEDPEYPEEWVRIAGLATCLAFQYTDPGLASVDAVRRAMEAGGADDE